MSGGVVLNVFFKDFEVAPWQECRIPGRGRRSYPVIEALARNGILYLDETFIVIRAGCNKHQYDIRQFVESRCNQIEILEPVFSKDETRANHQLRWQM